MEIPNEEEEVEEMPMPLNSTYSGVHSHMIHHQNNINHIIIPSSNIDQINTANSPPNGPILFENPKKPVFKYKECLKNHAASMGGHATDGCGEFMPSGEENALTCSACNCHRNFHRKEIENGDHINQRLIISRSFHNKGFHHNHQPLIVPPHHMIMSCNNMDGSDQSDDQMMMKMKMKKRFRTKFSQEQKEKMLQFAEKVGWKIQKLEESVVQQFCEEIGVKRRVLKVWMHNNKHILANKNNIQSNPIN